MAFDKAWFVSKFTPQPSPCKGATGGCDCEKCKRVRKLERTKHRRPHRPTTAIEPKKGGRYNRAKEKREWQGGS